MRKSLRWESRVFYDFKSAYSQDIHKSIIPIKGTIILESVDTNKSGNIRVEESTNRSAKGTIKCSNCKVNPSRYVGEGLCKPCYARQYNAKLKHTKKVNI